MGWRIGGGGGTWGGWRKVGTIIEAKRQSEERGYCRVLFDVLSMKRTANTNVTMDYICEIYSIFVSFLFGFCYLFGFSEAL